jgi:hypothetical protein
MKWIPILLCIYPNHPDLCSGKPIEGPPQPTYEDCQEAIGRALDNYAQQARDIGMPELGSYQFTRKYIRKICEPR